MSEQYIEIKGARVNNLRNVSVRIPLGRFVVITGVSGSGKSSLAFDTLYAEGQRRFVESLSSYARQFLGRMNKPECDEILGIPPAIAIEQKVGSHNPRSTVGTATEIYDYMRLLYARVGQTISPVSGYLVKKNNVEDIVSCISAYKTGTRYSVLAPLRQGISLNGLGKYILMGFSRVEIDGEACLLEDVISGKKSWGSDVRMFLIVDRLVRGEDDDSAAWSRLRDSSETAFFEGNGVCCLRVLTDSGNDMLHTFSIRFEADGIRFEEPSEQMFSFSSPLGACPKCEGMGDVLGIDERLVVPNTALSVYDDCVQVWHGEKMGVWREYFIKKSAEYEFPIFKPYYQLSQEEKDMLWHGHDDLKGIDSTFEMLQNEQYKIQYRVMLSRYRGKTVCPLCKGSRLKPETEHVKIGGRSISELTAMSIVQLQQFFDALQLDEHSMAVGSRLLTEIRNRLGYLMDVGVGYLTLHRRSDTLSGGENQRIRLATSLGSSLVGSLYVLDEPSIGLHSRDTQRLIKVLRKLQELGNTVVVVEHDKEIMMAADHIIDIGTGAGVNGGNVVYEGSPVITGEVKGSHTADYLTGRLSIPAPLHTRAWNKYIEIVGARENNLKNIDVKFPLNVMTCVVGVSGSGKSTLVTNILYRALRKHFGSTSNRPGEHSALQGDLNAITGVELIDQNPIGKSSRSNPATYLKAYDEIRMLMAEQPLAKRMGYTPSHFSFNADGGRCDECKGEGTVAIPMQFMADIIMPCEECGGTRFKKEVREVQFNGKSINDILNLNISEAIKFFEKHDEKKIAKRLQPLETVGLGYVKMGQSSNTLSGGESQRVKLAYYIGMEKPEPTLFIFDEPTTGLHAYDIARLQTAFSKLIERGHTIIVIEHNEDLIRCADHTIELGPEGGEQGGYLLSNN